MFKIFKKNQENDKQFKSKLGFIIPILEAPREFISNKIIIERPDFYSIGLKGLLIYLKNDIENYTKFLITENSVHCNTYKFIIPFLLENIEKKKIPDIIQNFATKLLPHYNIWCSYEKILIKKINDEYKVQKIWILNKILKIPKPLVFKIILFGSFMP